MVQTFIYENLLSHSKHRDYYVKLFEISINRKKQLDQKISEKYSIIQVCDDLIKETNKKGRKDGDGARKKFYVTTQLIFGTVMIYKCQAETLLNKVKAALVSCEFKFSNLNLNQSSALSKTGKGKNQQKRKTNENPQRQLKFYEDLEEEDFKVPAPKKSKKSDDRDTTMVTNAASITILESRMNTQNFTNNHILQDIPENEFSALTQNELDLFFGDEGNQTTAGNQNSEMLEENQTTTGDQTSAEIPLENPTLNEISVLNPDENPILNETLLQSPIETLNPATEDTANQIELQSPNSSGVKRALEEDPGKAKTKRPRLLEDLDEIQTLNENEAPNDIAKFDFQANGENVSNNPEEIPETLNESQTKSSVNPASSPRKRPSISEADCDDFKLPKIRKTVKKDDTVKKARKLIVDKSTKLSTKQMDGQLNFYGDLMIPMPRSEFSYRMLDIKMNMNNYIPNPLHRNLGEKIIYLYRRNLKKVPNRLAKKRASKSLDKSKGSDNQEQEQELSPEKRQKLSPENLLDLPPQIQTDLLLENQLNLLQDIEELPPNLPETSRNPPGSSETDPTAAAVQQTPRKKLFSGPQVYDEKDKWSQEKILAKLLDFWDQNSGPIDLERFDFKNKFVFAGVFHELLVLNKLQVVELIQVEGNSEIYDIQKGRNFDREFEVNSY